MKGTLKYVEEFYIEDCTECNLKTNAYRRVDCYMMLLDAGKALEKQGGL